MCVCVCVVLSPLTEMDDSVGQNCHGRQKWASLVFRNGPIPMVLGLSDRANEFHEPADPHA